MFRIVTVKDNVRVLPSKFGLDIKDGVRESLRETSEGKLYPEVGVILAVTEVDEVGEGTIEPEDGAIHYPAQFKMLVYRPEVNEVVLGEVVDVTEFGAFTRIGSIDALVHVSQIMDDKMAYDPKGSVFTGKKTGNKLQEGAIVRARVVGVSLGKGRSKVSLTMRQPCMGSLEWLERDKKKSVKETKETKDRKPTEKKK